MTQKPIICSVKTPQTISIGDSEFHSGCSVIDIVFPNMGIVDIGSISFRNYYTAFLTILCKVKNSKEGAGKVVWKKALKKKVLMPNVHIENYGQSKFVIPTSELKCKLDRVTMLRLVLMQPSPCWISFGLKEIKLYPPQTVEELSQTMPRWLLQSDSFRIGEDEEEKRIKEEIRNSGLPDPSELSSALHELWNLTEKSSNAGSSATVGRFDIDGCYEINLLSYGQN